MTPSEYLQSLTFDQLEEVLDADVQSYLVDPDGHEGFVDLIINRYDALADLADMVLARMPGAEKLDKDHKDFIVVNIVQALGIVCRRAEIDDMPTL